MLALFAYVGSLIAAVVGGIMLFHAVVVGSDRADKNAIAVRQAKTVPVPIAAVSSAIAKPAVSSASTPDDERRSEALKKKKEKKKKKEIAQRARSRVAERRPDYWQTGDTYRPFNHW